MYKPGELPNDLDSALLVVKHAETINSSLKDKTIEPKIYFTYSNLVREKGDQTKGKLYCEKAIESYKNLPASDGLGEA